jgi:hypothetical protein
MNFRPVSKDHFVASTKRAASGFVLSHHTIIDIAASAIYHL